MVRGIRSVEDAVGDGIKRPVAAELANREPARKSLVVATSLKKGEIISEAHLAVKRPATGMSPTLYWSMIGRTASQDYQKRRFSLSNLGIAI